MPKPVLKGDTQAVFMLAAYTMVWVALMDILGFGWNPFSIGGLAVFVVYSIWLLAGAERTMRAVRALPDVPMSEEETLAGKRFEKLFAIAKAVQMVLIIVSAVILGAGVIGNYTYIMPVIALIVGVHFFVLSRLVRSWVQAVLGTPIVAVAIISIIVISFGQFTNPMIGICCLVTALCTAIMGTWLLRFVNSFLDERTGKAV